MTVITLFVDPPRPGLVFPDLVEQSALSAGEAAELYQAIFQDLLLSATASGGDVLINYRPDDLLPTKFTDESEPAAEKISQIAASTIETLDNIRFEVQIGSTQSARVGNTVTHLLDKEDHSSVGILQPTVASISRSDLDSAAMKQRRADVVIGPGQANTIYYAGFSTPIDFSGVFDSSPLASVIQGANDADLKISLLDMHPVLSDIQGLKTYISHAHARKRAGLPFAEHTVDVIETLDLKRR